MNESVRISILIIAWFWVGLPFAYGVYALVNRVISLFTA